MQEYCDKLINKIFILLPIFEGKSHETKDIIYPPKIAYENFKNNLNKLKIEITGCKSNYPDIVEFTELFNIIEGLRNIGIDEHEVLRQNVFSLIDICKKIAKKYD